MPNALQSRLGKIPTPFLAAAIILAVTAGFFGDVFLSKEDIVLSDPGTDLGLQFVDWREFGFGQLQQGNLALWNPHIFAGMPYFGGFQSALLYPPNWFHLIFPLSTAINFGIALHIFLSGLFMYLWTAHRGLHWVACLLSALLFMFCGAHFLHVYAGHLTNLSCIAWIPLLFLALDGYFETRSIPWLLLGMFTVAMQILAGHPQYVFFTAVAAGIYTALHLLHSNKPGPIVLGFVGMYLGGATLSSVQLLAGIEAADEGVRSGGLPYSFASMFSFPPENFLTLMAPSLFGDMADIPYWGRWYLWETCLFVSVTGFILAVLGGALGEKRFRCFSVTMVGLLLLLALGAYTPLFKLLYSWVPGFNLFRSQAKFIGLASLFIVMLSGIGLDSLLRKAAPFCRRLSGILLVGGLLAGAVSLWIYAASDSRLWADVVQTLRSTGQTYIPAEIYQDPAFATNSGILAARSLFTCSGILFLLALLFFLVDPSRKVVVYTIALLAVVEILTFAAANRTTFDLESLRFPQIETLLENDPGDYRILLPVSHNLAMSIGARNIWGYDPGVLKRYAEFMTFTQGHDPDQATQYLRFDRTHGLYKMLRCRYMFVHDGVGFQLQTLPDTMPRLNLINDWEVITERDKIFEAMQDPSFEPRHKVILETPLEMAPQSPATPGTVRLVSSSTDHIVVEASLTSPAILLITDNYSKGWQAVALEGSDQERYEIRPANYILRAVPLKAGDHRLRVEYMPTAFVLGKWISIVSLLLFMGATGWCLRRL